MSILAETSATVIPAGTWSIDPSWSSLEFEVRKLGLVTIKGRVSGIHGHARGRRERLDRGNGRRHQHHHLRRRPRRSRPVAGVLRHRALSGAPLRLDVGRGSRRLADRHGRPDDQGSHEARRAHRRSRRTGQRPLGQRAHRARAPGHDRPHRLRAELERSASWRRLPPSERHRPQGVLRRGAGRMSVMRLLAISGSLRAGSYNTALARAAVDLRRRESTSRCSTGSATSRCSTRTSRATRTRPCSSFATRSAPRTPCSS